MEKLKIISIFISILLVMMTPLTASAATIENLGRNYIQLTLDVLWECPLEIKENYPLTLLRPAWELADTRYYDTYIQILKEYYIVIEHFRCPYIEKQQLWAEYEFLKVFFILPCLSPHAP
ncbi:MAG: hypothetical protein EOM40_19815 [Clostridia bacterium]|nr:hypothetical protein [Clostridia bacterium]